MAEYLVNTNPYFRLITEQEALGFKESLIESAFGTDEKTISEIASGNFAVKPSLVKKLREVPVLLIDDGIVEKYQTFNFVVDPELVDPEIEKADYQFESEVDVQTEDEPNNEEEYDDDRDEYDEEYDDDRDEYDDELDYEYGYYDERTPVLLPIVFKVNPEYLKDIVNENTFEINIGDYLFDSVLLDANSGLIAATAFLAMTDYDMRYNADNYFEHNVYRFLESVNSNKEISINGVEIDKSKLEPVSLDISEDFAWRHRYLVSDYDYNKGTAFNQIITGPTGCGKTYTAIHDEIDANRKFAYIAPCRQLAYETYRYYANSGVDTLSSGEIKINQGKDGNFYGVFESLSPEKLKSSGIDTLIIDEAHFVKDEDRGPALLSLIATARELDINVKLLTATQTFSLNDFEEIVLPSRFDVPEKKEISFEQAMENIQNGMQTIIFVGSIGASEEFARYLNEEFGIDAIAMNSSRTPSERLAAQIAFENKDVQVVVSTNVLAQGVNFECENLIIMDDGYETDAQLEQKIGRLGRPGTLIGKNEVYYYTAEHRDKPKKPETKTGISKYKSNKDFIRSQLVSGIHSLLVGDQLDYNSIKYCIPELTKILNDKFIPADVLKDVLSLDEDVEDLLRKRIDYMYRSADQQCANAIIIDNILEDSILDPSLKSPYSLGQIYSSDKYFKENIAANIEHINRFIDFMEKNTDTVILRNMIESSNFPLEMCNHGKHNYEKEYERPDELIEQYGWCLRKFKNLYGHVRGQLPSFFNEVEKEMKKILNEGLHTDAPYMNPPITAEVLPRSYEVLPRGYEGLPRCYKVPPPESLKHNFGEDILNTIKREQELLEQLIRENMRQPAFIQEPTVAVPQSEYNSLQGKAAILDQLNEGLQNHPKLQDAVNEFLLEKREEREERQQKN